MCAAAGEGWCAPHRSVTMSSTAPNVEVWSNARAARPSSSSHTNLQRGACRLNRQGWDITHCAHTSHHIVLLSGGSGSSLRGIHTLTRGNRRKRRQVELWIQLPTRQGSAQCADSLRIAAAQRLSTMLVVLQQLLASAHSCQARCVLRLKLAYKIWHVNGDGSVSLQESGAWQAHRVRAPRHQQRCT